MALIPGAYARAAGLQSEINKVTVTRVAGSEVQFRRTIDTYQRDLRYHMNQIGREQRLLRRSLRRYSQKLLESSKDRHQRQKARQRDKQANSDLSGRTESNVRRQFPQHQSTPEQVVRLLNSASDKPEESSESGFTHFSDPEYPSRAGEEQSLKQSGSIFSFSSDLQHALFRAVKQPSSPDSGVGSEVEDVAELADVSLDKTNSQRDHKVFLTSSRPKLPYLKVNRGGNKNKQREKRVQDVKESCTHTACVTQLSDNEELLPSITEESEEAVDQLKLSISEPYKYAVKQHTDDSKLDANKGTDHSQKTPAVRVLPPVVTSLNTKSVGQSQKYYLERPKELVHNIGETHTDPEGNNTSTENAGVAMMRKKAKRKTGVSYGDLIKLQHSHRSSSRELFRMVDRLASVHGIVDPPSQPSSSIPSFLDPRTNVQIKRRAKASGTSDGIVKQAAVLYSMKYGYNLPDTKTAEDVVSLEPLDVSSDTTEDRGREEAEEWRHDVRRSVMIRIPAITSDPVQQSTLSVRNNSTDVTSPFYEFDQETAAIFDDFPFRSMSPSRWNKSKPMTLTEMSAHATVIRERTLQSLHIPQDKHEDTRSERLQLKDNRSRKGETPQKGFIEEHKGRQRSRALSPVPRRSRSLSHHRRDRVQEQLRKRLTDEGEDGQMAWQSAFGRLKMIHTLFDLSQHFSKH